MCVISSSKINIRSYSFIVSYIFLTFSFQWSSSCCRVTNEFSFSFFAVYFYSKICLNFDLNIFMMNFFSVHRLSFCFCTLLDLKSTFNNYFDELFQISLVRFSIPFEQRSNLLWRDLGSDDRCG